MNEPALNQKTTFLNQDNFKRKLPTKEELKLQIEQLKGELHNDEIALRRIFVGAAYLTFILVIILSIIYLIYDFSKGSLLK